jgi:hypothetical protein
VNEWNRQVISVLEAEGLLGNPFCPHRQSAVLGP